MIELDDIALSYGSRRILDGVSLRVGRGELIGVVGRNGAGKTTLVRIALGLAKPDRGAARIDDADLSTLEPLAIAHRVAAMAQDEPLQFPLSVKECVLLGRVSHLPAHGFETDVDVSAAADAMREVGVLGLAERLLSTLSGGERRRVLLARALAQGTTSLVLDEPAANLDLAYQLELFELLRGRVQRGAAVLLTVHDLNLALRYCDRVALLVGDGSALLGAACEVLTPARVAHVFGVDVMAGSAPDGTPYLVAVKVTSFVR